MSNKKDYDIPILFTVQETAEILRVKERTIYNYIKSGKLDANKIGKEWKISREALQAFIDSL